METNTGSSDTPSTSTTSEADARSNTAQVAGSIQPPPAVPYGQLASDPRGTTYEVLPEGGVVATFPSGTKQTRAPAGAMFLSKQAIIAADDSGYEDVYVPEWGGWVRVKRLSAAERGKIENMLVRIDGEGQQHYDGSRMRELFSAFAVVDPMSGTRLFSDKELHYLGSKSAAALDRVYESATRQARVSKKDAAELAGNSPADLSDDSAGGTASA